MGEPSTDFMRLFLSRRGQVIISSFLILFPVSMARSLAGLAKFSGIALAAILTIIACTLGVAPTLPESLKGDTTAPFPIIKPEGIPAALGVFCFAYVCQHNILLNYKSLKNATEKRFATVARVSIGVTVLLTLAVGM